MAAILLKGFSGIRSSLQHVLRTAPVNWENSGRGLLTTLAKNRENAANRACAQKADGNRRLVGTLHIGKSKKKSKLKVKHSNQNGVARKQNRTIDTLSDNTAKKTIEKVTTTKALTSKNNGSKSALFSVMKNKQEKGSKESKSRLTDKKKMKFPGLNLNPAQKSTNLRSAATNVALTSKGHGHLNAAGSKGNIRKDMLPMVPRHTQFRKEMFYPFGILGQSSNRTSDVDRLDLDLKGNVWPSSSINESVSTNSPNATSDTHSRISMNGGNAKDILGIKPFTAKVSNKDSLKSKDTGLGDGVPIVDYEHLLYNERRYTTKDRNLNSPSISTANPRANNTRHSINEVKTSKPSSNGFILVGDKLDSPPRVGPTYGLSNTKTENENDMDDLIEALRSVSWDKQVQQKLEAQLDAKSSSGVTKSLLSSPSEKLERPKEKRLDKAEHTLMAPKDQMENYIFGARLGTKERSKPGLSIVPNNTAQLSNGALVSELKAEPIIKKGGSITDLFGARYPPNDVNSSGQKKRSMPEPVLSIQPSEITSRTKQPKVEKPWSTELYTPKIIGQEGKSEKVTRKDASKKGHEIWSSSARLLELKKERKARSNKKDSNKFVDKRGQDSDYSTNNNQEGLKENKNVSTRLVSNSKVNRQDSDLVRELKEQWKNDFSQKFLLMQQDSLLRRGLNRNSPGLTFNPRVYSKKSSENHNNFQLLPPTKTKGNGNARMTPERGTCSSKTNLENDCHSNTNFTKVSTSPKDQGDSSADRFEEWLNLKDEGTFRKWTQEGGDVRGPKSNGHSQPSKRSYPVPDIRTTPKKDGAVDSEIFWFDPKVDIIRGDKAKVKSGGRSGDKQQRKAKPKTAQSSLFTQLDKLDGLVTMNLSPVTVEASTPRPATKNKTKGDESRVPKPTTKEKPKSPGTFTEEEESRLQRYMEQLQKHQNKKKRKRKRKEEKKKRERNSTIG